VQVQIIIACSRGPSLRRAISSDTSLEAKYGLTVTEQQRAGRQHGWAKVYSHPYDTYGAINHWDSHAGLLVGRVVTRNRNKPGPLIGKFVGYLMTKYRSRINSITIVP
jgi:hypothetical protein